MAAMPAPRTYKCEGCGETVNVLDQPEHFMNECPQGDAPDGA